MEQKKTLWIVLAAGSFLLVVLGAALIANSQTKNKPTPGSVWISPVVGETPVVGGDFSTKLPGSDEDETPSEITIIQDDTSTVVIPTGEDSIEDPTAITSKDATITVETATITAGEVTVVPAGTGTSAGDKTEVAATDKNNVTTIDLNSLGSQDAVKPANEAGTKVMKETETASTSKTSTTGTSSTKTGTTSSTASSTTTTKPASTSTSTATASTTKPASTSTAAPSTNKTSTTGTSSTKTSTATASTTKTASTSTTTSTAAASTPLADSFWIQAASYSNKKNADDARNLLEQNRLPCEVFTYKDSAGTLHYRVRVGPYTTKNEAKYWQEKIAAISFFANTETYITNSNAPAK